MSSSSHNYDLILGFRFRPTDEELIRYLLKFVSRKNFSCDYIRVEDLYGKKKPWDIFKSNFLGDDDTKINYFFTKLKKTKAGGSRFSRRLIGGDCWKGLDKHKSVFKGSMLVGSKKSFRYIEKEKSVDQGIKNIVWNMNEYTLNDNILKVLRQRNILQHEDYVLCCIKRKSVRANDHMEIADSGNNAVAVMNSTIQEHDYVTSSSEDQGTGVHDLCPSNQFSSSEHNNAFDQNIEEMASSVQSHVEYVGGSSTTSNQFTYYSPDNNGFQLQQDHSNIECDDDRATVPSTLAEINIDHVDMKMYECVGSLLAEYSNSTAEPQLPDESGHDHIITSPMAQGSSTAMVNEENINAGFVSDQWSKEQVHNIEERAPISFTDMLTSSDYYVEPPSGQAQGKSNTAESQLPICIDEQNITCPMPQGSSSASFVSDQWSKEQVHNIEERAPITYTRMITSSDYYAEPCLVISSDECFTMDEVLGSDDDVIAADLDWMPTQ